MEKMKVGVVGATGMGGNPLQYSCLENPMNSGAWRATVHRVTKSRTQLKQFSMYARLCEKKNTLKEKKK